MLYISYICLYEVLITLTILLYKTCFGYPMGFEYPQVRFLGWIFIRNGVRFGFGF